MGRLQTVLDCGIPKCSTSPNAAGHEMTAIWIAARPAAARLFAQQTRWLRAPPPRGERRASRRSRAPAGLPNWAHFTLQSVLTRVGV